MIHVKNVMVVVFLCMSIGINNIAYKKRIDLKLNKKYFESCFIEVDKTIFQTKHNVIIGGLYKPPNISIDIFNENLEVILNTIGKERKNAFLIGDYNINTLDELSCKSKQRQDFINLTPERPWLRPCNQTS